MSSAADLVRLTAAAGARCSTMGCGAPATNWLKKRTKTGKATGRWQCAACFAKAYAPNLSRKSG